MIIDAVLLVVAKISAKRQPTHAVKILPMMRLATEVQDGIAVRNPESEYEVWLTGKVDYGVIQYKVKSTQARCLFFSLV